MFIDLRMGGRLLLRDQGPSIAWKVLKKYKQHRI